MDENILLSNKWMLAVATMNCEDLRSLFGKMTAEHDKALDAERKMKRICGDAGPKLSPLPSTEDIISPMREVIDHCNKKGDRLTK